jgi:hypothetical protein
MRRLHLITPLLLGFALVVPAPVAHAQIGIGLSITIAPPILPVYVQPPIPAPGYLWTPGYWAYGPDGYYWVPGTWVQPPVVGLLWTPGYWGWNAGVYAWNGGYWGPHVGFYGGVNYGFGYGGVGYLGGRWNNGVFAYNSSVNNFGGTHITNVYNQTVVNNTTINRVSYNGGTGGVAAQPTAQEAAATRETHVPPTAVQTQHVQTAAANPALRASANNGQPAIAATSRPNVFTGPGVVAARPAVAPAGTGTTARPGGAPGAAIGQPGETPRMHSPITSTPTTTPAAARPGAVAPGTEIQHPTTPVTPPGGTGTTARPGGAPGPAIGQPGAAPTLHGPTTPTTTPTATRPATVTPGTQIQRPSTPVTPPAANSGTPRPPTTTVTPRPPTTTGTSRPATTTGTSRPPTSTRPVTPAARPAAPPRPAPAAKPAPKQEEKKS